MTLLIIEILVIFQKLVILLLRFTKFKTLEIQFIQFSILYKMSVTKKEFDSES
jgi:hypothetical protein